MSDIISNSELWSFDPKIQEQPYDVCFSSQYFSITSFLDKDKGFELYINGFNTTLMCRWMRERERERIIAKNRQVKTSHMFEFRDPTICTMLLLKWVSPKIGIIMSFPCLTVFGNPSICSMSTMPHVALRLVPIILKLSKSFRHRSLTTDVAINI